jgi:hypothetical protein
MIAFSRFFTEQTKEKIAVFSYGRYNPPTTGHQLLIDKLVEVAKQKNGDAFLIPTHTIDKKKNPLTLEEKTYVLEQMCDNVKILKTGKTFVEALKELQNRGYTSVYQIAGSDRIPEFTHIINTYNNKPNKVGEIPFSFANYELISSGERDPDSETVEGMSASKLRSLAINGDLNAFVNGMSPRVDSNLKHDVYNIIRKRMI